MSQYWDYTYWACLSSRKTGFLILYIRNENMEEKLREISTLCIFRVVSIFGGYSSETFVFSSVV
jgi:uncharacterized protein YlbG (UPF0298 family)